jgi:hypothetical protein
VTLPAGTHVDPAVTKQRLTELAGTGWSGNAELWLDPAGNSVCKSQCTLQTKVDTIDYTWAHEGQNQQGCFAIEESGASWVDSWHQPEKTACAHVPGGGLFTVQHTYGPGWGWRTTLSERPDGELVLQMTNIAPWGEEARAVRMVFTRNDASSK